MHGVAADERLEPAFGRLRHAVDDRQVRLSHEAFPESLAEGGHRGVRLRDDHRAGRILVQPVHDARASLAADRQHLRTMRQQSVDERAIDMPDGRMHDQTGRLGEDDQRFVLEEDVQRDRLRHEIRRRDGRHLHAVRLPGLDDLRRAAHGDAVAGNAPRRDQGFDPRTRQV
jgi:hypothetical protein